MAPFTRMRASEGGVPTALNARYYAQSASASLIITESAGSVPVAPSAMALSIGKAPTPRFMQVNFETPRALDLSKAARPRRLIPERCVKRERSQLDRGFHAPQLRRALPAAVWQALPTPGSSKQLAPGG